MADNETIEVYNKQVEKYAEMVEGLKPDNALKKFVSHLPPGGRVLDLGCGPGNSSAYMHESGLRVDATDASQEMVRRTRETSGINANTAVFDDLSAVSEYDGIWANFSLLHAAKADFSRHLGQISTALKPNGYFHIGMKLGEGEIRDSIGRLYSYYTEEELRDHLAQTGFNVVWSKTGEEKGLSGDISPFAVILSQKTQAPDFSTC